MNNCIYTKLAAEVPNSDLLRFGELRFNVTKSTYDNINTKIRIKISGDAPEAPVMKAYGGTFSVDGVSKTEHTLVKNNKGLYDVLFDVINEDYTIGITNAKYYIDTISAVDDGQVGTNRNIASFNIEDLNFSPYITYLSAHRNELSDNFFGSGVFNPITTNIGTLVFYGSNVQIDLSVIGRQPNITLAQTDCIISGGDLSDVAGCTKLQSFYAKNSNAITGSIEDLYELGPNSGNIAMRFNYSPNIGGSVDALADAMVARTNPKTSGKVEIYGINTSGITCSVPGNNIRITFDPSATKGYTLSAF